MSQAVLENKLPGSSRICVTKSDASATVEDTIIWPPHTAISREYTRPVNATTDSEFPEGGLAAWLTVLGAYAYPPPP